jgi:pimeloyl-ACP methyl ester carboxylesterase
MTPVAMRVPPGRRAALRTLAFAFVACCAVAEPTSPQVRRTMSNRPNIVLVHGVWGDASSWSAVIQRLQSAGYHASAVQLTVSSFDEDVERTRALVAAQDGPTLVVAHSFGGAIVTRLGAEAPNVIGLVYESAFAPDEGETMKALLSQAPQPRRAAAIQPDARGYLWLDAAGFVKFFAPDVPPAQSRVLAAVQKPIAARVFFDETPFGPPAWKHLPTWYLVTTEDQMIPPDAQRFFAQRMGATVTTLAGSHAAMVSHPQTVTNFILQAADAAASRVAVGVGER